MGKQAGWIGARAITNILYINTALLVVAPTANIVSKPPSVQKPDCSLTCHRGNILLTCAKGRFYSLFITLILILELGLELLQGCVNLRAEATVQNRAQVVEILKVVISLQVSINYCAILQNVEVLKFLLPKLEHSTRRLELNVYIIGFFKQDYNITRLIKIKANGDKVVGANKDQGCVQRVVKEYNLIGALALIYNRVN